MGSRLIAFILGAAASGALAMAQTAPAPGSGLPVPPPVEKEIAAHASNVTEVTLGKNMLAFAAKFMSGKDEDEAATRQLIQGLDGVYVREYDFDKEGEYTPEQVDRLRAYFETSDWTPIVRERSHKNGENTDVMMKLVNGETRGMFILEAEPRELTIVLILGPIRVEDLVRLRGIGGLGVLGDVVLDAKDKDKDKTKDKDKKGGTQ
jgi:uncharacterized protein DUF4252